MIRYPDLNSPSVDNSRKRLRGSSQEPKVENEFLQAVSLIGKKREKKKEENEVALPHSAAPVVTSKPPPPIATSELDDEYGSRSQGNVVSLFSKNKKTPTSIEKGKEIDHILKTSRAKPYEMLGIDDNYNEFNTSTADKKAIARAFHKLSNRVHPDKNEDPRATKAFQSR
jgi:3-oxoacyl-ACP reductase-like protein